MGVNRLETGCMKIHSGPEPAQGKPDASSPVSSPSSSSSSNSGVGRLEKEDDHEDEDEFRV
jgi:hypothetical protein